MSRRIKEDWDNLLAYLNDYSLSDLAQDAVFKEAISACHKKYYSYLVFVLQAKNLIDNKAYIVNMSSKQYDYLRESCSDMGQTFFLIFHGCYKGAKLLLRSSIENFIKSVCMDEKTNIDGSKSVYEIFEYAKDSVTFQGEKQLLFHNIHNAYSNLCQDVHTANINHMEHITALRKYPNLEKDKIGEVKNLLVTISQDFVTLLCLKYNQFFHAIDYENKEIIMNGILKDYRKAVHNFD